MSTDAFGILLGNIIYAVYIGTLSDSTDTCKDGRKVRQGGTDGTVSAMCSIRVVCGTDCELISMSSGQSLYYTLDKLAKVTCIQPGSQASFIFTIIVICS